MTRCTVTGIILLDRAEIEFRVKKVSTLGISENTRNYSNIRARYIDRSTELQQNVCILWILSVDSVCPMRAKHSLFFGLHGGHLGSRVVICTECKITAISATISTIFTVMWFVERDWHAPRSNISKKFVLPLFFKLPREIEWKAFLKTSIRGKTFIQTIDYF